MQNHIKAQRIALRYIAEKIEQAESAARSQEGMEPDEIECFAGWWIEEYDFQAWAMDEGYSERLLPAAWAIMRKLLGHPASQA